MKISLGYLLLAICTLLFAASLAMEKWTAATNSFIFCALISIALGWFKKDK